MAIGHLSVKVGKAGKAAPHAAYISRIGKYADRVERGEQLEATGYGNMPAWAAHNPLHFWEAADRHERANGSTYREHELALPRELSPDQRRELVEDWIAQEIGTSYAYQYAIHNPKSADGQEQPHAHLMFSERKLDGVERDPEQFFKRYNAKNPEKGGAKKDNTGKDRATRKEELKAQRTRWGDKVNVHLLWAGESARVDMRSYKDRGLDIQPEPKMSPAQWRNPVKRAEVLEHREANAELAKAKRDLNRLVPDLKKTLAAAKEKANPRATPEAIKREWEKYLNAADNALKAERTHRRDAYEKAYRVWSDCHKTEPERPFDGWTILDKLAGKPKKFEKAHEQWEGEEKRLRFAKIDAERANKENLPNAVQLANTWMEEQKPELYKEWQRIKALEDKAREDQIKAEVQQRRQQRNIRDNGKGR